MIFAVPVLHQYQTAKRETSIIMPLNAGIQAPLARPEQPVDARLRGQDARRVGPFATWYDFTSPARTPAYRSTNSGMNFLTNFADEAVVLPLAVGVTIALYAPGVGRGRPCLGSGGRWDPGCDAGAEAGRVRLRPIAAARAERAHRCRGSGLRRSGRDADPTKSGPRKSAPRN